LAASIAPGLGCLGLVLPYTPLHYLLFHEAANRPNGTDWLADPQDLVLVMTSANPGGEPLVTDNAEAYRRLDGIADGVVTHDRDIVVRVDDSVQRFIGGVPTFIRRARGFVPEPIKLPRALPPGLAVGAHLKTTVCVTRGDEAFVSQHIGDLDNPEALIFFEETVAHLLAITDVTPTWVAHDLHPDFFSTRFAQDFADSHAIPAYSVQHHHAHVSSGIAEHGLSGPVLGLALDGFGLGEGHGSLNWGGEALITEGIKYQRVGHLASLSLPGGEAAFRAPWRMAAAVLHAQGRGDEIAKRFGALGDVEVLKQMLDKDINVEPSTSCGRLFDAAAGLLGIQPLSSFDGQAPMKLEALVTDPVVIDGGWKVTDGVLDLEALLRKITDMDPVSGANAFHGTLIQALSVWAQSLAKDAGIAQIVLSGGCILNRVLSEGLEQTLRAAGFKVFRPRAVPPGDGGISLGQAYVAALAAEQKE
jgi:hydrogenase maturation protein HypF